MILLRQVGLAEHGIILDKTTIINCCFDWIPSDPARSLPVIPRGIRRQAARPWRCT
jgi:hypothetical protein